MRNLEKEEEGIYMYITSIPPSGALVGCRSRKTWMGVGRPCAISFAF
jgi:hypothetical protein